MENNTLNGFEIFDDFMPGGNVTKNITKTDDKVDNDIDIADLEPLTDEELDDIKKVKEDDDQDDDTDNNKKDTKPAKKTTTKVDDDDIDTKQEDDDQDDNIDNQDNNDNAVSAFFGVIADKMGWDIEDDEDVPTTPEELVDYFQNVIEENSVPQYASEEVQKLDEFVRNGGNIRDYFSIDNDIDLDNISIEDDENNQKLVLREFLKEKGFNTKQIDKKLSKYEDAGLLEDEAEDALEALKEIKEQKKQQLLIDQENQAKELKTRQQAYFKSVVDEIKAMDNVRGIKIPEKDKKVLLEYIFKPDQNGQTGFQKDWSKSVKNLIESAYFTMKGDTLMKAAKVEGQNKAIDRFKNSLNNSGVSRKTKKQDNTSTDTMWDSFARQIRNF